MELVIKAGLFIYLLLYIVFNSETRKAHSSSISIHFVSVVLNKALEIGFPSENSLILR